MLKLVSLQLIVTILVVGCDNGPPPPKPLPDRVERNKLSPIDASVIAEDAMIDRTIGETLWYYPVPSAKFRFKFYTAVPYPLDEGPKVDLPIDVPTSFVVLGHDDINAYMLQAFARVKIGDQIAYIRSEAFDTLRRPDYPGQESLDHASPDDKIANAAREAEEKQLFLRDAPKREAERKKIAKTQGVSIGMTQEQVLESKWGRPQSKNRITSAGGTMEQWVYGGNYLYFENGILRTVQN